MIRILISILFLITTNSFAEENKQRNRDLLLDNPKDFQIEARELNKFPEIYQFTDSILQERNDKTGINSDAYYTRKDWSRLSIAYGFSHDYEQFSKLQSFDLTYLNQFDNSYKELWWLVQFKQTTAKYEAVADETSSTKNEELQSFTNFGVGLSHRFKTLADIFHTDRLFETISVLATYNLYRDNTANSEQYAGLGYNAEYGFGYRSSRGVYYGTKLSYTWVHVERRQVDNESLNERSLVFGWTSIGFEYGYFF